MSLGSETKIDQRTAADVAQQLQDLLGVYAPEWKGKPNSVGAALIGVSARFAEVLIQRLNRVPEKNFLAFLDLLGAALLPPQPARVPVTFLLAKGSLWDAVVPAGTQVAAPAGSGEKDPVIYETENELVVTAAQLASAYVRDPDEDTYADYSDDIITTIAAGRSGTPVFHGNRRIAHILYLGQSAFLNSPRIVSLSLDFRLESLTDDDRDLAWEIWNGTEWQNITPINDGTNALRRSGIVQLANLPAAQTIMVGGISKEWIRCRLLTPIVRSSGPRSGLIRAAQLPAIHSVGMRVHLNSDGLLLDQAYSTNSGLIDLSKDFYPFGEKPKFNDTLWLALDEAFSNAGAIVTLDVRVSSAPASKALNPSPADASDDLKLRWEVWNGSWIELGTTTPTGPATPTAKGFSDSTNAFLNDGSVTFTLPLRVASLSVNGKESFWVRVRIISGNYGVEGHFEPSQTSASGFVFILPTFRPPSIRSLTGAYNLDKPPLTQSEAIPEAVLAENDSVFTDFTALNSGQTQPFVPFQPSPDERPTLYLGFVLPAGRAIFPNNTITMFFRGADLPYGQKTIPLAPDVSRSVVDSGTRASHKFVVTNPESSGITYDLSLLGSMWAPVIAVVKSDGWPAGMSGSAIIVPPGDWIGIDLEVSVPPGTSSGASDIGFLQLTSPDGTLYTAQFVTFAQMEQAQDRQLQLVWEYWSGQDWIALNVRDDTSNLTTSGTVEFLAPPDFAAHPEFGKDAWWLRVRWETGDYDTDPRIDRVFLNTVMAAQTVTIRNEILGSSDGSANQGFGAARAPVLAGQNLAVRELERPSGEELNTILGEEGPGAVPDDTGESSEIWITWHEVGDFYASDSLSRHYTLDHTTGQVGFGDGLSGMIPPVGSANVRLTTYKTGGGAGGNRPAGSIVQLKTTVPYIDKVTNYVDAIGGVAGETMDSLIARAPLELRHHHRAVTPEDYEDMVHLASSDVARVLCVPNRDLIADPFDRQPPILGSVSLIIVPSTRDAKPQPNDELVRRIKTFISSCCPVTATVFVVGALYLRVDVQVEIGLASLEGAGTAARNVQNALAAFLHPLTGGLDGKGWEFGREPHRSDIYRVIEEIPEVDHVNALTVQSTEDFPGSRETGRFLVYSGTHSITLVFDP